ncbi:MAG: L-histidine N(alpha)-methyltransferase [Proteobacteria bacterium]|nr:L-histidine N(alpha)-methyltransferase [Pseudomonadota bacterium]
MDHAFVAESSGFVPSVAEAALDGLLKPQKTLPARLFYDEEGCRLFRRITELPEYYLTRAEHALLDASRPALTAYLRRRFDHVTLVEFGTSDEAKAAHLFAMRDALQGPLVRAYVAIDIAGAALEAMRIRLRRSRPDIVVRTVAADFEQPVALPQVLPELPPLGFFAGSTIGNFDPPRACAFLRRAARTLGGNAALLVGFDLRKDPAVLVPAYDDAAGVTAAFNLNLLARLNREAEANFDVTAFHHRAVWNAVAGRIEMHLVSRRAQQVRVAGHVIAFVEGEFVHTEDSYKHTEEGFTGLARAAGWQVHTIWKDPLRRFALGLLDHPAWQIL